MNWRKIPLLKILFTLFLLNSVSFFLYFFTHPDNNIFHIHRPRSSENHSNTNNTNNEDDESTGGLMSLQQSHISKVLKPWPILPSYLPWSQNQQIPFGSCEAYFGNGFTHQVDLLKPRLQNSGDSVGWFRCFYSQTLHSSICEGAKVRMFPDKIRMSRGGEDLKEVIGRGEDEELPEFEAGAFDVNGGEEIKVNKGGRKLVSGNVLDEILPQGHISRHTMRGLIDSVHVVGAKEFECDQWVEEPTILVTRFEYANLFHTVTDWYSAYVSSRVTGLPNRPHLVFVDGHCKTQLEETWKALFSSLNYAKNFSGPVCFRHAVFSPLGYETAMFEKLDEDINCNGAPAHNLWQQPDDKKTARISEFGEMIRASFGFPVDRHHLRKSSSNINVLFVRREDYLAHPRHGGKVQSRLSNEQEVFDALKEWVSESDMGCKINLVNGLFAHMTMKEQAQAIQDASVIVGAHGAGLTHIVSALPNTVILEIISRDFRRPHFRLIAQWKGLQYHAIDLMGSYAEPPVVINKLNGILKSLGC